LPLVKLKNHKIASISSCSMVSILAIATHTAVVRIPAVEIFKVLLLDNFLKIRVRVSVIWGEGDQKEGCRRERPYILNSVASRNYLATFDSQQLATLNTKCN